MTSDILVAVPTFLSVTLREASRSGGAPGAEDRTKYRGDVQTVSATLRFQ